MRSLLFVPADAPAKIEKALGAGSDVVILDLEDSVAPHNKDQARGFVADTLKQAPTGTSLFVRVNALDSGMTADDIDCLGANPPAAIVQPKTATGQCVEKLAAMAGRQMPILAIATETASAMFGLGTYAGLNASLIGLAWGAEDLSNDLGAQANRDAEYALTEPYRLARSLCLIGARAATVEPVDTVFVNFRDEAGLEADCNEAVRDGFTAKMAIHPAQVPVINRVFTPTPEQTLQAQRVVEAFAEAGDAGVVGIEGRMYDMPHLHRARKLLERARKYGVD